MNHVMQEESRGTDVYYVPFHTELGVRDRGFDGGFLDNRRVEALSVKHSRDHESVQSVRSAVARDMRRYPGRVWTVVTNVEVAVDDPIRTWLEEQAPGSRIPGLHTVDLLLDKYPWLARHYGVAGVGGFDLFRPPPPEAPPIAPAHDAVLAALHAKLEEGGSPIALVAPVGPDARAAFTRFAATAAASTILPEHVRVVVHADSAVRMAELGSAIRSELRPSNHAYLFLVPPGPLADQVAERLRDLPGREDHTVVAFISSSQAQAMPPSTTMLNLEALSDEEMQRWLIGQHPDLRLDVRASVTAAAGGSPAVASALVDQGGIDRLQTEAQVLVRSIAASLSGFPANAVRECVAWLLLGISDNGSAGLSTDQIADEMGVDATLVRGVADAAVAAALIVERHGELRDVSRPLSALVFLQLTRREPERWIHRVRGLAPEVAWSPTCRLATLELSDLPVLALLDQDLEVAAVSDYYTLRSTLRRAETAAVISDEAATRVFALLQIAETRARAPDAFAAEAHDLGLPGEHFTVHMLAQIEAGLRALLKWPRQFERVIPRLIALAQRGTRVDLVRVGKGLGYPVPGQPTRADVALDIVENALSTEPSAEVLDLVHGLAETLLAASVEMTGAYSAFVTWSRQPWADIDIVHRRRARVVTLLLDLTYADVADRRQAGWEGLRYLWSGAGAVPMDPPREVHDLASAILTRAMAAFDTADAFEDWTWAEGTVLAMVHRQLASVEERETAVSRFPTDPRYRLWRFLAAPDRLLASPEAAAAALREPDGWRRLVDQFVVPLGGDAAPRAVAGELAATVTADDLVALLERAQRYVDTQERTWASWQPLEMLAASRPRLFLDLLKDHWARLPEGQRRAVAFAAQDPHHDALRDALWSERETLPGAFSTLRSFRTSPELASPVDLHALLPTGLAVSHGAEKIALLQRLASATDVAARTHVALALAELISFADPPLDPEAVLRTTQVLLDMDAGSANCAAGVLLRCFDQYPADRTPRGLLDETWLELQVRLGWFLIERAVQGLPELVVGDTVHAPALAAARADPTRWLQAVTDVIEARPSRIPTSSLLPQPLPSALTTALVQHAVRRDDRWLSILGEVGARLTVAQATPFVREALRAGRVAAAVVLTGVTVSEPDAEALAVLREVLDVADQTQAKQLAARIAGGRVAWRTWSHDGPDRLRALADHWRGAPSDHGSVTLACHRIARHFDEHADRLAGELDRMP